MSRSAANKPGRQRGSIAILAAMALSTLALAVALALDTGRLMLEKRRLQQRADLAALAASQQYCDQFSSAANARAAALQNLQANGFDTNDASNTVAVALGTVGAAAGARAFTEASNGQAVQVHLHRTVPASLFAGGFVGRRVTLQAEAVAQRSLIGALSAGTRLLSLNTSDAALLNPILGRMLGIPLNLTAAGYNGLVAADITMKNFRDALIDIGVVTPGASLRDVANANTNLGNLLQVMANAADPGSGASTLANLRGAIQGTPAAALSVSLSNILSIDPSLGAEQGLDSSVNSMALLLAGAMAANVGNALAIALSLNTVGNGVLNALLGPVLSTTLQLNVISPPRVAIGRFGLNANGVPFTLAQSAQVELRAGLILNLAPNTSGLGSLIGALASIQGDVGIGVSAAGGNAWLDSIVSCPTLRSPQLQFSFGSTPTLASLKLGSASNPAQPAQLSIQALGSQATITANFGADLPIAASSPQIIPYSVDLSAGNALPTTPVTATTDLAAALSNGLTTLGTSTVTNVDVTILKAIKINLDINVLNSVVATLNPLLTAVTQAVLQPVLRLLGVNAGQLDMSLLAVEQGNNALLM